MKDLRHSCLNKAADCSRSTMSTWHQRRDNVSGGGKRGKITRCKACSMNVYNGRPQHA